MRILIADDHELVRYALRVHLNTMGGIEIVEAQDYSEIFNYTNSKEDFDLVLADIHMPGVEDDFTRSLSRVRAAFPRSKVVVFSATFDAVTVTAALKTGIHGFIAKTTRGAALISALRLVLEGEIYVPASIMEYLAAETAPSGHKPRQPPLSERETACLRLLSDGLRNKEIARHLKLQENTVKIHLRGVFRKLGAANRIEAVRIALNAGLLDRAGSSAASLMS